MPMLPAISEKAGIVTRLSVASGVALISALFPTMATGMAFVAPAAFAAMELRQKRAEAFLEEALRSGDVTDLSDEQLAAFIPMGLRFMEASRQGEYEHNLRLLASYISSELKSAVIEPGSFLDMARRLEGLSGLALTAAANIKLWIDAKGQEGIEAPSVSATAALLSNPDLISSPMQTFDAAGALADLMGRGFLIQSADGAIGGGEFYNPTQAFLDLLSKASDLGRGS